MRFRRVSRGLTSLWVPFAIGSSGCSSETKDPSGADAGSFTEDAELPDARGLRDATTRDAETVDTGPEIDAGTIPGDDCISAPSPGRHTIECGSLTFDLSVPPACMAGGCGLVVDVHGFSMSGIMEENNTELGRLGGDSGYIVIQPNANGPSFATSWSPSDDPIVFDFMTRVETIFSVDPKRVHFTGFSQGGYMTWRFVCAHSDHLASVAVVAGASNCPAGGAFGGGLPIPACSYSGDEVPSEPIPVLYMHGREDSNYVPFSCAGPQVEAVRAHYGLTEVTNVAGDLDFEHLRYTSTSSGTTALLETIFHSYSSEEAVPFVPASRLQGHCIPGSTDSGDAPGQFFSFKCEQNSAFVWGEVALEFFRSHPRP